MLNLCHSVKSSRVRWHMESDCTACKCSPHKPQHRTLVNSQVRGPSYLSDKKKVQADDPLFALAAVDLIELDAPTHHIARYLPSLKCVAPCLSAAYYDRAGMRWTLRAPS